MERRPNWLTRVAMVGVLTAMVAVIAGCGPKNVGRSILSTKIGDREIKASLDGGGFISSQGDAAAISFGGGKLIFEKDSVQLDGKVLGKLPKEAKKVEVDYTAGKLTITVDGESVMSTEIKK